MLNNCILKPTVDQTIHSMNIIHFSNTFERTSFITFKCVEYYTNCMIIIFIFTKIIMKRQKKIDFKLITYLLPPI